MHWYSQKSVILLSSFLVGRESRQSCPEGHYHQSLQTTCPEGEGFVWSPTPVTPGSRTDLLLLLRRLLPERKEKIALRKFFFFFATVVFLSLHQLLIKLLVLSSVLKPQKKMKSLTYFRVLGDLPCKLTMCFAKGMQKEN